MRRIVAMSAGCLLLMVPIAWQVQQQESPQQAAEKVMRDVFDAHEHMQWARLVTLIHPRAITLLQQSSLQSAEAMERSRDQPNNNPELPQCVAEYYEKQRAQRETFDTGLKAFGVETVEELRALSPEEFMARWLEASDMRTNMIKMLERQRPGIVDSLKRVGADSLLQHLGPGEKRTVLSSVLENDSTVMVLYRTRLTDGPESERTTVATVRRSGKVWRFWPSADGLFGSSGITMFGFAMEDVDQQGEIERRMKETVRWDAKKVPSGRAFLSGFGQSKDADALVIEVGRDRIRVPRSAFEALAHLLEISSIAPAR